MSKYAFAAADKIGVVGAATGPNTHPDVAMYLQMEAALSKGVSGQSADLDSPNHGLTNAIAANTDLGRSNS